MRKVRLEYMGQSPLDMLKKIELPLSRENSDIIGLDDLVSLPLKTEISAPHDLPIWLLWELASHLFYLHSLGKDHHICSIRYTDLAELKTQIANIKALFEKVSVYPVIYLPTGKEVMEVHLQNITDYGLAVANKMMTTHLFPTELLQLYENRTFACEYQKNAIFRVYNENEYEMDNISDSVKAFVNTEPVQSINISGLTLQQCTESSLVQYVAKHKKCTYIWVDRWNAEREIYGKTLYWA